MANLSATGQVNQPFQSAFDLLKPQLSNVLFQKYGDQFLPFFNMVMTLGQVKPVAGPNFGHYEEGWIARSFQVQNNVVAPGTGLPITVQVSTADVQTTTNYVYPRERDLVKFTNQLTGTITAVANPSPGVYNLTIEPQNTTFALPAVTAGETIQILSNTFAEGTNQPNGRNTPTIKYLFDTQIIKEAFEITGSAMTNQYWYDVDNSGKTAMPYGRGQLEAEYRQLLAISQAMLWSVPTNNANIGSTTMTGIFPWLNTGSNTVTYTPGNFTIARFDQLNRVFDKRRAGGEYLYAAGPDQYRDVENGLSNLFTQNPNLFGADNIMNKKFGIASDGTDYGSKYTVSFNFKGIQKTNRTYWFTTIPQLAAEQGGGAPGFDDSYYSAVIPLGFATDPKTGDKLSRIAYRYKEYGGVNRMMKVWEEGAMAQTPTNGFDNVKYNVLHEGGTELFGIETWGLVRPT